MQLVIVESPTKAKTIQKFLGKTYEVTSSYGHVRDLPKSKMGIDTENNFTPSYVIPTRVRKKVNELKKQAARADTVILATDEDREGEAIAWHLIEALALKKDKILRIAFHEITNEAIDEALKNPREIDYNLVDAQQARRMLDRLVGYELSPFLWRKIYYGLSAGRVQSVAVRMVAEREKEIEAFKPQEYWSLEGEFETNKKEKFFTKLHSKNGHTLTKFAVSNKKEADNLVRTLEGENYVVKSVIGKNTKKKAPTPFTTSLLQQEASRRLNMSPKQTMMLAQQLYEGVKVGRGGPVGLITYMRTDSMNMGSKFLDETANFLKETYGSKYALDKPRLFKSKSKNAQEAHEAIRPTSALRTPESVADYLDAKQLKLYKLIWQRAVASQMPEAEMVTTTIDVETQKNKESAYILRSTGSLIAFDGWQKVYPIDSNEVILPKLTAKEIVVLSAIAGKQHFTEPPARYTDASLIKALEEHGIGRPSTYAPTISTITDRGYVERIERRLHPTELAHMVNNLLVEHFPKIVDYEFTARLEEELDDIAEGKKQMTPVLKNFYVPFKKHLDEKDAMITKESVSEETTNEVCDQCGKPMIIKFGRFGKFMACTGFPECKNTKQINSKGEIEEEEKTDEKCDKCSKPMQIKRGRYGTFLGCTGYPDCRGIKSLAKPTGVKCPECKTGDIVEKRSKKGKTFYACNGYPDCKFALWSKPTGDQCPECKSLLIMATKGAVKCSAKDCSYLIEEAESTNKE